VIESFYRNAKEQVEITLSEIGEKENAVMNYIVNIGNNKKMMLFDIIVLNPINYFLNLLY